MEIVVHPDNRILFSTEKKQSIGIEDGGEERKGNELSNDEKTWRKLRCILLSKKKSILKGYILHYSR